MQPLRISSTSVWTIHCLRGRWNNWGFWTLEFFQLCAPPQGLANPFATRVHQHWPTHRHSLTESRSCSSYSSHIKTPVEKEKGFPECCSHHCVCGVNRSHCRGGQIRAGWECYSHPWISLSPFQSFLSLPSQRPLQSGSTQSPLQSPLRSGSPQSSLRPGSPQSPLQSPLRPGSPQSPLQSPLRPGSPQSPLQSPLRPGSHRVRSRAALRPGSPQSPLQSPLRPGSPSSPGARSSLVTHRACFSQSCHAHRV